METTVPFTLRYGGLFVLLLTFGWWMQTKDLEPAIAFLSLFIAFVGQDIYFYRKSQDLERNIERDKQLLEDLLGLLKPTSEIAFLRDHDHGASFLFVYVKNIFTFIGAWNNSNREFLNPNLEKLRRQLLETASMYVQKIAHYTYSNGQGTHELSDYLERTNPQKWEEQRQELNDLADKVVTSFDNLIRAAKKKL